MTGNKLEHETHTLLNDGVYSEIKHILYHSSLIFIGALSSLRADSLNIKNPSDSLMSMLPPVFKNIKKNRSDLKLLAKINKIKKQYPTPEHIAASIFLAQSHAKELHSNINKLLNDLNNEEIIFKAHARNEYHTKIALQKEVSLASPAFLKLLTISIGQLKYKDATLFLQAKLAITRENLSQFNQEFLWACDLQHFGIENSFSIPRDDSLNKKITNCIIKINTELTTTNESRLLSHLRSSNKEFLSIQSKINKILNGPEPDKVNELLNNFRLRFPNTINLDVMDIINNPNKEIIVHEINKQLKKQARLKHRQKGSQTKIIKTVLINQNLLSELINTQLDPDGYYQKYPKEKSKSLAMVIDNFLRKTHTEIKQAIEAYGLSMDITETTQKRKTDFTISKRTDAALKKLTEKHEISLQNLLHILLFYAVQEVRSVAI